MGKPTGFLEYERRTARERPFEERLKNWQEFQVRPSDELLMKQGARCMDCGIPFCHTGTELNRLTTGCPIHNLIPEFNDLVYRGHWKEAYLRLSRTNNFPEFTGRICPAPCEGSCVLGINQPPVTIKLIENAIIERAFDEGWVRPRRPEVRSGRQVAVVGSGPAGLACADQLNQAGHRVTVFERNDRIGGLLTYGIPNMKLDKGIVERRVELLRSEGIRFITNCEVGVQQSGRELLSEFDAVVLAIGAAKPRDLDIPGRNLDGIHFAMDYLVDCTQSVLGQKEARLSASGKDVVVIGGGDTGTDCVASACRQGCRSLLQFEILPRPPESRPDDDPWPLWPLVLRTDYGQKEAEFKFGRDPREFSILTKEFLSDGSGRLVALRTVRVQWTQSGGSPPFEEIPGTEEEYPAQLVLLAMGFLGPEERVLDELGLERDEWSNIRADERDYRTGTAGVFAAGDARRGQSLVVWAIREGREAAAAVHRYLEEQNSEF